MGIGKPHLPGYLVGLHGRIFQKLSGLLHPLFCQGLDKGLPGTAFKQGAEIAGADGKMAAYGIEIHLGQVHRLEIAKSIVKGIGVNIYELLYHYYKHGKKEVKGTVDWIRKEFYNRVDRIEDIKSLMTLEGEAWSRFYRDFQYFLPEDFIMNKRVRRPPDNPMNAMVSFGNMMLYGKTISALYQTHLDQRISFLHEPSEGRFSLSLDISEVFKPVLVYRTIFDLVNNRKIQVTKHFEKKLNYCLLNEEGRMVFITAFEERMESIFQHSKLKRRVSYRTAIKLDCYKLIKYILEEKEFVPFSLKEGE